MTRPSRALWLLFVVVVAGVALWSARRLWLAGQPLDEINRRANELAAFVCTQPGATPLLVIS